jgi:hypothetical protein
MLIRRHALGIVGAVVAIAGIVSTPAFAQPDRAPSVEAAQRAAPRYEQRVYDLATLLARVPDYPGPNLDPRFPWVAGGVAGAAFTLDEPHAAFASADLLIALIKTNIAEDSWSDQRTSIEAAGEELVVVQTPEVHAKITHLIASLRRTTETQIVVDGTLALVEDALLDECRTGATNPAALSDTGARALAEAMDKGERATRIQSLRAVARNGQRVHVPLIDQRAYAASYDVTAAAGAAAMAPRVGYLMTGTVLDVRPLFTRGRLACEVRFDRHDPTLPIQTFETGIAGMSPIELRDVVQTVVNTTVTGTPGRTVLAGRVEVADPKAPRGTPAHSLCFFIRPSLAPAPDVQPLASEEKRQMRIFDTGILTSPLRDFAGMRFGIDMMNVKDVEVSTGAFALDPPPGGSRAPFEAIQERDVMAPETLVRSIRHNVAPETWSNIRNTIAVKGGLLCVRQTAEVLDAVGIYLDKIAARRWQMVVTRADLLGTDAAAYRAIREKYPRLGAGATRLEAAEAAELMARAAKGDGLARVASGEVAGMNRQRVHITRAGYQDFVGSYAIISAPLITLYVPETYIVFDGALVECRPVLGEDRKTVHANLRIDFARLARPIAVARANDKGLRVHRPSLAEAPLETSLVAPAGEPMLVGLGGPVRLAGAEKYLLAIVRLTPATD